MNKIQTLYISSGTLLMMLGLQVLGFLNSEALIVGTLLVFVFTVQELMIEA